MSRFYASAPLTQTARAITTAPDGGWPGFVGANHANGVTYLPYTDNAGLLKVRTYNESTQTASAATTVGGPAIKDWHDMDAILRRSSDGKLVAITAGHSSGTIYCRISTNADDPTSWATNVNIDAQLGGTAYTYPVLLQLGDPPGDPIFLIYRDFYSTTNHWCYSKTTDGGTTWAAETVIWAQNQGYLKSFKTSETRIDFVATTGSAPTDNASLYHFYYDGVADTWHKSDGTSISLPITTANATLIYNGSTQGVRFPMAVVNDGTEIACTFPAWTTSTTQAYKYARYTAGTWTVRTPVADCGTDGYPGSYPWIEGSTTIDPADIDHVVMSILTSGSWRIWDYLTADAGATWGTTQITSSGDDDIYPWFVLNHVPGLDYIWLKGTATSYTDFSLAIYGYG